MDVRRLLVLGALAGTAVLVVAAGASSHRSRSAAISPAPPFSVAQLTTLAGDDWLSVGGDLADNRYSTLTQIDKGNVEQLGIAWHTHLGLPKKAQGRVSEEGAAVAYDGVLYIPDGWNNVYALDGATGKMLWKYDAVLGRPPGLANRGVAIGDGHVYIGQSDGNVVGLDQMTGKIAWKTKVGLPEEGYNITSAPVYYEGMVIAGVAGGDTGARSFAVAMDAKTGLERWRWYVVPAPGEVGSGSWPPRSTEWMHGGGAIWIYPSIDTTRNLLYLVTGNPVPWNGRGPGDDLWTDSIVALHVENGQFAWGFQTVHHDIWDYDVTNPPILFDAVVEGTMRHGVAVASKTGWMYVLDRYTGRPLIGVREKKVPQLKNAQDAAYAQLSKTQPYPVGDAFANQCASKKAWRGKKAPDGKPYRVGCIFTPYAASKKGSFVVWQPSSAVDWPPSAFSPVHNYAYLCATDGVGASTIGAIPKNQQRLVPGELYVGVTFGGAPKGVPPNYGRIVAMNVTKNRIAWTKKISKPCYSGMMATAGDLVFAGLSKPLVLEARSASSGKVLWHSPKLDAGPNAPAITYTANGKQYVAILAGGNNLVGLTRPGDSVYAFALP